MANTAGLDPTFKDRTFRLLLEARGRISIISAYRSYAEQARLYKLYLSGRGNLAAPPGRSNHERGLAIDFGGDIALLHRLAPKYGIVFPVRGEAWHGEPAWIHGGRRPNGAPTSKSPAQKTKDFWFWVGVWADTTFKKMSLFPYTAAQAKTRKDETKLLLSEMKKRNIPTGFLGSNLDSAIRMYQRKVGLPDDGVVGQATVAKLRAKA